VDPVVGECGDDPAADDGHQHDDHQDGGADGGQRIDGVVAAVAEMESDVAQGQRSNEREEDEIARRRPHEQLPGRKGAQHR